MSTAPDAQGGTAGRHLVDPEMLPALDAMPSFSIGADTLDDIRQRVAAVKIAAPLAPNTKVEERLVPGPDGTSLRILIHTPEAPVRTGALLWLHGGGMVKQPFRLGRGSGREPGGVDTPAYAAPARAVDLAGVAPASISVGDLDLFLGENLRFA